ncbi:MAG TPA: phage tail tape measure protein [Roseovarius sp.]|nr:phage tail tape measure protein [Roseovarius sp.]
MSDLNMQLVLRLIDRATGPAKAALQKVEQAGAAMETSGRRNIALADRMAEKNRARSAALMGETAQVVGMGAALWALTEPAIQAEARMAEVAKTVTFNDENGIARLQRDISALVTSGGLAGTAEGVMDIIAAAGRMGVVDENLPDAEKRKQLLAFAEDATKMSVAFGISADDAGTTLARWRENLNLSHDQAMLLGDQVNVLGNTMATNEADILKVINRQGVLAEMSGLSTQATASLSATLLAAGTAPEIAATGMKNFLNTLTRGEDVTDRQRKAFKELGIEPTKLAKAMQEDAAPAIFSVLDALDGVEDHRRNAIIGQLFGQESIEAIAPLIANADAYREALAKTADEAQVLGLMEEEYRRQAETTLAQRRRLLQYLNAVSTTIGSALLPMLNELMETIMPVIGQITEWAAQNPELIEQLGWVVAGLFGFKLASLALRFALLPLFSVVGGGVRAFGLMQLALATLAGRAPLKLGSLVKPLVWGPALIPKLTKAAFVTLAVGSKLAVSALVKPLAWGARHVPPINWVARAGALSWTRLIRPLVWAAFRFIPVIGWLSLAGALAWNFLIKPLGWDKYLPSIEWDTIVGSLSWRGNVPVIDWSEFASAFSWPDWIGELSWDEFLSPLAWWDWVASFQWASRISDLAWSVFVPMMNLADFVGKLVWFNVIEPLGWDKYLPSIDWSRVWGAFSWEGWLPEIRWAEFISAITWPEWIGNLSWADFIPLIAWSNWFSFTWASVLPKWDWRAIIPEFNLGTRMSVSERQALNKPNFPGPPRDSGSKVDGQRALGGAVRAGFTYRINELGEELFTPSTNGRVTPAREAAPLLAAAAAFGGNAAAFGALPARAAAVMTAASLGLGLAGTGAEAAPAFTTGPATQDARPAVRIVAPAPGARPGVTVRGTAPTAPTSRSVTMTVGDIHVHTAPGQSPEAIAEAVMERIDRARRRADDALHDGGDYD